MGKIIQVALLVALAVAAFFVHKNHRENMRATSALNEELMKANLALGRAQTKLGDAQEYIGELEADVQKEIKERQAIATRYGELLAKYEASGGGEPIIITVPGEPIPVPMELEAQAFYFAPFDDMLINLGKAMVMEREDFRLKVRWYLTSLPNQDGTPAPAYAHDYTLTMRFKGIMVETLTPSGAVNNYMSLYEVDSKGKVITKLELEDFKMVVDDQRTTKLMWAPHLDLGGIVGLDWEGQIESGVSAGVSLAGYGLTKNDLSWRFARLGLHASRVGWGVDFAPALWNLGGPVPLMSNMWVGPYVSRNPGITSFGLMFNVVL